MLAKLCTEPATPQSGRPQKIDGNSLTSAHTRVGRASTLDVVPCQEVLLSISWWTSLFDMRREKEERQGASWATRVEKHTMWEKDRVLREAEVGENLCGRSPQCTVPCAETRAEPRRRQHVQPWVFCCTALRFRGSGYSRICPCGRLRAALLLVPLVVPQICLRSRYKMILAVTASLSFSP